MEDKPNHFKVEFNLTFPTIFNKLFAQLLASKSVCVQNCIVFYNLKLVMVCSHLHFLIKLLKKVYLIEAVKKLAGYL